MAITFQDFMEKMLEFLPDAVIDEDNEGQIVIYTGLKEAGPFGEPDSMLVSINQED